MIFENGKDIEIDIKNKLSSYIKYTGYNNLNLKTIIPILSSYLIEMKNINEINDYRVTKLSDISFNVFFTKNNIDYDLVISLLLEMRSIKIEKLKSNKIVKTYMV